jgi:2-C-methyl-D-erythritol 2,4-cyclodiphosphate synthase
VDLLARALSLVRDAGFEVGNLDATVIAERPRLAPHIPAMRERIADALSVDAARVGVKATTHEGLGALGRGEGVAAMAVVLVEEMGKAN